MKMQKMSNKTNVLSESLVYDYVAGNMSDQPRKDFEQALLNDPDLRDAVEAEKCLRNTLLDFEDRQSQSSALNTSNFDALLEVLDDDDDDGQDSNISQFSRGLKSNWYTGVGIAASAVFAMVLFFSYDDNKSDDFNLLSDDVAAKEIDFNNLVKEQKIGQIWLKSELPSEKLSALFTQYKLKPIGRAGNAWIVASSRPLTAQRLAKLALVESFEKVRLISYDAQATVVD